MNELEYNILDELYFVTAFNKLQGNLDASEAEIKKCLKEMIEKKWVSCFQSESEEISSDNYDFDNEFKSYFYLATKTGLLLHNSN